MTRTFLIRGMLCGVAAGLLVFIFARVFGEPNVDGGIGFEEQLAHMAGAAHEHGEEIVSRDIQSSWGLLVGVMVYAVALGGLFSLLFAYAWGRMGKLGVRASAALLAGAAFVAVYLVPFAKYPANPPSVGNPETIGTRTALYFGMMVIATVAMIAAVNLGRSLLGRWGGWNASITAGAAFLVLVGIAYFLMPTVNEVPDGFPAPLLWQFRTVALAMQLLLWTSIGLLFGWLTERSLAARSAPVRTRAA
ncbi:MAG TPA: CbtA family protein [Devosia sp.]|nr:CbtA family protein [Devosia sp.]